jgi:hypothetical protein
MIQQLTNDGALPFLIRHGYPVWFLSVPADFERPALNGPGGFLTVRSKKSINDNWGNTNGATEGV